MTPQNKLYEDLIKKYQIQLDTVRDVIYTQSDILQPALTAQACERFIKAFIADLKAITAYEQEQPEAIAGEKTAYETALDYLSEMGYGSGTNFTSKGVASLLADFASQQTSAKDKEIEIQQAHIDDQDQLIFDQTKEIADLKERISELEKRILI